MLGSKKHGLRSISRWHVKLQEFSDTIERIPKSFLPQSSCFRQLLRLLSAISGTLIRLGGDTTTKHDESCAWLNLILPIVLIEHQIVCASQDYSVLTLLYFLLAGFVFEMVVQHGRECLSTLTFVYPATQSYSHPNAESTSIARYVTGRGHLRS